MKHNKLEEKQRKKKKIFETLSNKKNMILNNIRLLLPHHQLINFNNVAIK